MPFLLPDQHVLLLKQHHLADNDQRILHRRRSAMAESSLPIPPTRCLYHGWGYGPDVLRIQDQALAMAADDRSHRHGPIRISPRSRNP